MNRTAKADSNRHELYKNQLNHSRSLSCDQIPLPNFSTDMTTDLSWANTTRAEVPTRPSQRKDRSIKKEGRIRFPWKLHKMLEDAENQNNEDIICWLPDGLSFRVKKPKEFVSKIMPHYFRHTNFRSFQRQLYHYNFSRIHDGPARGAYWHPEFTKKDKSQCPKFTQKDKPKLKKSVSLPSTTSSKKKIQLKKSASLPSNTNKKGKSKIRSSVSLAPTEKLHIPQAIKKSRFPTQANEKQKSTTVTKSVVSEHKKATKSFYPSLIQTNRQNSIFSIAQEDNFLNLYKSIDQSEFASSTKYHTKSSKTLDMTDNPCCIESSILLPDVSQPTKQMDADVSDSSKLQVGSNPFSSEDYSLGLIDTILDEPFDVDTTAEISNNQEVEGQRWMTINHTEKSRSSFNTFEFPLEVDLEPTPLLVNVNAIIEPIPFRECGFSNKVPIDYVNCTN